MKKIKKTCIISFTEEGKKTALKISEFMNAVHFINRDIPGGIKTKMEEIFSSFDTIVFISATGIAVRLIAPYIVSKISDPAVICVNDTGKFAISLLSGHLGGANEIAKTIAYKTGAIPVITTASDNRNFESLDIWMEREGLKAINKKGLTYVMTQMADFKKVRFYGDTKGISSFPKYPYIEVQKGKEEIDKDTMDSISEVQPYPKGSVVLLKNDEIPSTFSPEEYNETAFLFKPCLNIGLGFRRNKRGEILGEFILNTLKNEGLNPLLIKSFSSADLKSDEKAVEYLKKKFGVPFYFYSKEELNETIDKNGGSNNFITSSFVEKTTGAPSVSEASALRTGGRLTVRKRVEEGMTISISDERL